MVVVVRRIRPHTEADGGKSGKAGSIGEHILQMVCRDQLGVGHAIHVYILGEEEIDILFFGNPGDVLNLHFLAPF